MKSILLIIALHGAASFDAWSTNRWVRGTPPGWHGTELNPAYRPFAGHRSMYFAANLGMVPYDIWLLRSRKAREKQILRFAQNDRRGPSRKATAAAFILIGLQTSLATRNTIMFNHRMAKYAADKAAYPQWDGVYRQCPQGWGINAAGCPLWPAWTIPGKQ